MLARQATTVRALVLAILPGSATAAGIALAVPHLRSLDSSHKVAGVRLATSVLLDRRRQLNAQEAATAMSMVYQLQQDLVKQATIVYQGRQSATPSMAQQATYVRVGITALPVAQRHRAARPGRLCLLLEAVLSVDVLHARQDTTVERLGCQLSADSAQQDTTVQLGSPALSREAIFVLLDTTVQRDRHRHSTARLVPIRIKQGRRHASNAWLDTTVMQQVVVCQI